MKLSAVIIRLALNTMVADTIAFAIVGSSNCCSAATSTQDTNTNCGSNVASPSSSSSSFGHPSSDQPVDGIVQVESLVISNRSSRKCDLFVEQQQQQQEQQQQAIVAVDEVDDDQHVAPKSVTTISDTDAANGDIRTLTESRSGEVPATITSVALPLPSSSSSSSGEPSSDQPVDANVEGAMTMLMTVFDLFKKFQGPITLLYK